MVRSTRPGERICGREWFGPPVSARVCFRSPSDFLRSKGEDDDDDDDDEDDDDEDDESESEGDPAERSADTPGGTDDGGENTSLAERCDRFMLPWIGCIQSHRNTYSLISNAFYKEDYVDPLEFSIPDERRMCFAPSPPRRRTGTGTEAST
ncbi:hypothetical protein THAOC_08490 [Thalassiosira oceanica]|uniref:Uncharacterized protein n=1 Tax=Thalassiosira oceanica TaxID=159749 RepID=K0SXQ7_THAOC|nr:hypothetical protein THAOC_08490 [Thalassiosira oceanica]|eukprot:EJK70175.1 hypothetical protein THAOC_08490 [Thalassiosira oceanica]